MTYLRDIYACPEGKKVAYNLLCERPDYANISHESASFAEHVAFMDSKPYSGWHLIYNGFPVGAIYLTDADEVGVFVFKKYQRKGYASWAIKKLMKLHPREQYFANINPLNAPSIVLFERLGFAATASDGKSLKMVWR